MSVPQGLDRDETDGVNHVVQNAQGAVADGRLQEAVLQAIEAIASGIEHPFLLNLAAFEDETRGRYTAALDKLHRAMELAPADETILAAIGHCLIKMGRPDEALIAFDSALGLNPSLPSAHNGRGLALETLRDLEGAWSAQQRAVRIDPSFPAAHGALAALAANSGEDAQAREHAIEALRLEPGQEAATLTLATLDFRAGDMEAVRRRLNDLIANRTLAPLQRAAAERLRADALDALGDHPEAFKAYATANACLRRLYAPQFGGADVESGVALTSRLKTYFLGTQSKLWKGLRQREPLVKTHVFLVGFPRSGTTLLEQVLASHSDVVTLEERPTLGNAGIYFLDAASLDALAHLGEVDVQVLREQYWSVVSNYTRSHQGKVFVDKLPLNTLWLPYISKLFPEAKIIFAIRDPRDVVLSCFRRRFVVNALTYEFTDIRNLADFYVGLMELAQVYMQKLPLKFYIHRHEVLVSDFDSEMASLCKFLKMPWSENFVNFAETARRRDIRTPSASQVRRGLYSEGIGQWRAYSDVLGAVISSLQSWVDHFGYDP